MRLGPVIFTTVVALALLFGIRQLNRRQQVAPPTAGMEAATERPEPAAAHSSLDSPLVERADFAHAGAPTNVLVTNSWLDRISNSFRFTPEQLATYLTRNGTNAETLLVAAQLGTNRNEFIKLAAAMFPDDPRVQFAVVAHDVYPEAKRQWLERFKESAPDNPLANYLSARDYGKAGDRTSALRELAEAGVKPRFNDYTLDRWQSAEEAQIQTGRPVAEAKADAASGILLPHLAQMKGLAVDLESWQKEYLAAGDTASAAKLAELAHTAAQHLEKGEGAQFLINQLVGVAMERITLRGLPPDSAPDFLGKTAEQRIAELTQFRETSKRYVHAFDDMMNRGDESDIISFYDRMKVQGEFATLRWLEQKQKATRSTGAR